MIKVVVTGSESTGKTELARALGDHFGAPVAGEFVRDFVRDHGRIDFGDHGVIARGQIASEDVAIATARNLVILDTDLLSTAAYCEHYFGVSPAWIEEAARERAGDVYLLMSPDIPWVADGIRDRGDRRTEMHELFRQKLAAMGMRAVEIGGDRPARFNAAVSVVQSLLARGK